MRPKYLEMSAWGPYKDVVKVDFEAFDEGALFLITGPTGAGKTTIFDGICFAIYGNASGKERAACIDVSGEKNVMSLENGC